MIHTTITNCLRYTSVHPLFEDAFKLLGKMKATPFTAGKQAICGENLYSVGLEYDTKDPEDVVFEAHKKYIDVMLILEGQEEIGYLPMEQVDEVEKPYDESIDAQLTPVCTDASWIRAIPGDVIIFFPEDFHAPGANCGEASHIKKIIMKVLLNS